MILWFYDDANIITAANDCRIVVVPYIIYCESISGYTNFYMIDGKFFHSRGSLKYYKRLIDSDKFINISPVYLINFEYFEGYELENQKWIVIMAGNKRLEAINEGFERLCRKTRELIVIGGENHRK